ncbi:hypothetical protein DFAR_1560018 [Desulfarculales bacterium]
MFIDYAVQIVDEVILLTGEVRAAQIFVAVLGASNYIFAEATWTQGLPDWIGSHQRAFQFFGGVTELMVIDNLKSVVSKTCRYELNINPTYQKMAAHYDTAVLPARVRKPRDKAKAAVGVQLVERWILAALRTRTFFSLAEPNQAIRGFLDWFNNRLFKKLPGSRRSKYEFLDKPALKPLPATAYQYAQWKKAKVHIDYHVEVDRHCYSGSPINWWAISWTSVTRSVRRNASIRASGWPATVASWSKAASPPWPSTYPASTRSTPSGPPKESPTGYTKSARPRSSWPRESCTGWRIPSKVSEPA